MVPELIAVKTEPAPPLEPSPPNTAKRQVEEGPSRLRRSRYKIPQSTSLRLSRVPKDEVQRLEQALADYGVIKGLDSRRINEGYGDEDDAYDRILVVNYFELKSAVNAYQGLHGEEGVQVDYNYETKEQLSSINESPDSGGSEKSEEGSDSERKAREALESRTEKLKQEYEALDDPQPGSEEFKNATIPASPKTMPLPFAPGFFTSPNFLATTQFLPCAPSSALDQSHNFSDSSFDGDTLNEGYRPSH